MTTYTQPSHACGSFDLRPGLYHCEYIWHLMTLDIFFIYFSPRYEAEVNESHFFNFETRMKISPIQSRTSRRDENFLTLNLGLRDKIKKKSPSISGIETRSRFIIFILRLQDENKSSKLLTFLEVSDLNGLINAMYVQILGGQL